MLKMNEIFINGTALPTPKLNGLTIKPEKVWAPKTGRAQNGELLGFVVAIKYTIQIEWPALSYADAALIDSLLTDSEFFTVTFRPPGSMSFIERTMYAGTPTFPVYSYANGIRYYTGVAVDLIEK